MTRGRFYSSVMPVAGILDALVIIVLPHHGTVVVVGAMCFALIAVARVSLGPADVMSDVHTAVGRNARNYG